MVSLPTHPRTPYQTDPYSKYSNADTNVVSPISVTMKPEDAEPKTMSVQERIRALNKSTNDAPKPVFRGPVMKRSGSPWKAKATKTEASMSESKSVNISANKNAEMQMGEQVVAQRRVACAPAVITVDDENSDSPVDTIAESNSSNSGEARSEKEVTAGQQQTDSNTLQQYVLDSAPRDKIQLFAESEEDTEVDFDASAAVKYWRRSKGEPDDEEVKNEANDVAGAAEDEQVADQDINQSSNVSTCDETDQNFPPQQEFNSEEVTSKKLAYVADDHETEVEAYPVDEKAGTEPTICQPGPSVLQTEDEAQAPPPPEYLETKPTSPPPITMTVPSYNDMDAVEPKEQTAISVDALEQDEAPEIVPQSNHCSIESNEKFSHEKSLKERPTATRSFSQRAFEKRSSRRKAKEGAKSKDEAATEVESASVLSGSTTHSASTVHTTTLSTRATRLLREKRQGNVNKTDGLATSLAKNLLRGESPTGSKSKLTAESTATGVNDDVKSEAHSSTVSSQNLTPDIDDVSSKFADNSKNTSEQVDMHQQYPAGATIPPPAPTGIGERRYSNPNLNHPLAYQMQRQPSHVSHVSQYSNPIQFGPSPSFQNVEVGISTGPRVYQVQQQQQHYFPHFINSGMTQYSSYSNAVQKYTPSGAASTPKDLLVQPKFSRYNSFDVQNPTRPPIQNVLTEDSASWSESRTQDGTQDGTLDGTQDGSAAERITPVDSVGRESHGYSSTGQDSSSAQPSIESISRLDSFPKGRSFDKECSVLEHIQNVCDTLSPKSYNSNPTPMQFNHSFGVTFCNTLSDEDVAIEVEYVAKSTEQEVIDTQEDRNTQEDDVDTCSSKSDGIYSLSTRDMDSKDSFSYGIA